MYRRLMWLKFWKKFFFVLITVSIICSLYLRYIIVTFMYPEDVDCSVYRKNLNVYSSQSKANHLQKLLENVSTIHNLVKKERWSKVAQDAFIYSAYHVKCPSNISFPFCIQLIGITSTILGSRNITSDLKCAFRNQLGIIKGGLALVERLEESHFLPYTAAFFYCDLKSFKNNPSFPEHVTLYDDYPSKWFNVDGVDFNKLPQPVSLSLCVRPLYGEYLNFDIIVTQFLAYYSTMGVDHFIFYNYNASESALRILNFIASTDLSVDLLQWNIPLNQSQVHEYGQIVFTQDCLSRSRYKYSHTIIVDLDEFITPKKHHTIVDLIQYLDDTNPHAGSYAVSSVLFCEEFPPQGNHSLPILNRNKRQKTTWKYRYRSKYIARPERVINGGIHFVWHLENGYQELVLSKSVALLHHYRHCCGMSQTWFLHLFNLPVLTDEIVVDDTLIKLSSGILNHTLVKLIVNHS